MVEIRNAENEGKSEMSLTDWYKTTEDYKATQKPVEEHKEALVEKTEMTDPFGEQEVPENMERVIRSHGFEEAPAEVASTMRESFTPAETFSATQNPLETIMLHSDVDRSTALQAMSVAAAIPEDVPLGILEGEKELISYAQSELAKNKEIDTFNRLKERDPEFIKSLTDPNAARVILKDTASGELVWQRLHELMIERNGGLLDYAGQTATVAGSEWVKLNIGIGRSAVRIAQDSMEYNGEFAGTPLSPERMAAEIADIEQHYNGLQDQEYMDMERYETLDPERAQIAAVNYQRYGELREEAVAALQSRAEREEGSQFAAESGKELKETVQKIDRYLELTPWLNHNLPESESTIGNFLMQAGVAGPQIIQQIASYALGVGWVGLGLTGAQVFSSSLNRMDKEGVDLGIALPTAALRTIPEVVGDYLTMKFLGSGIKAAKKVLGTGSVFTDAAIGLAKGAVKTGVKEFATEGGQNFVGTGIEVLGTGLSGVKTPEELAERFYEEGIVGSVQEGMIAALYVMPSVVALSKIQGGRVKQSLKNTKALKDTVKVAERVKEIKDPKVREQLIKASSPKVKLPEVKVVEPKPAPREKIEESLKHDWVEVDGEFLQFDDFLERMLADEQEQERLANLFNFDTEYFQSRERDGDIEDKIEHELQDKFRNEVIEQYQENQRDVEEQENQQAASEIISEQMQELRIHAGALKDILDEQVTDPDERSKFLGSLGIAEEDILLQNDRDGYVSTDVTKALTHANSTVWEKLSPYVRQYNEEFSLAEAQDYEQAFTVVSDYIKDLEESEIELTRAEKEQGAARMLREVFKESKDKKYIKDVAAITTRLFESLERGIISTDREEIVGKLEQGFAVRRGEGGEVHFLHKNNLAEIRERRAKQAEKSSKAAVAENVEEVNAARQEDISLKADEIGEAYFRGVTSIGENTGKALQNINTEGDLFEVNGLNILEGMRADGVVADGEAGLFVGEDGLINDVGREFVRNALLGKLVDNSAVLDGLSVTNKKRIGAIAPYLLAVESISPSQSVLPEFRKALLYTSKLSKKKSSELDSTASRLDTWVSSRPKGHLEKAGQAYLQAVVSDVDMSAGELAAGLIKYSENSVNLEDDIAAEIKEDYSEDNIVSYYQEKTPVTKKVDVSRGIKDVSQEITEWAKEHIQGKSFYTPALNGNVQINLNENVYIGKQGINRAVNKPKQYNAEQFTATKILPVLLDNAEYFKKITDRDSDPNVVAVHRIKSEFIADGELISVRMMVKETNKNNEYPLTLTDLTVENIKTLPRTSQWHDTNISGQPGHKEASNNNITPDNDSVNNNLHSPDARGKISFNEKEMSALVTLYQDGDIITFLHEVSHFWLKTVEQLVGNGKAAPELVEMFAKVKKEMKVADGNVLSRKNHEYFASSFEAYLTGGEAPVGAMLKIFNTLRKFATSVYKYFKETYGRENVSPELRDVFDHMLATEEELKRYRKEKRISEESASYAAEVRKEIFGSETAELEEKRKQRAITEEERLFKKVNKYFAKNGGYERARRAAEKAVAADPFYGAILEVNDNGGLSREVLREYLDDKSIDYLNKRHSSKSKAFVSEGDSDLSLLDLAKRAGYDKADLPIDSFIGDLIGKPTIREASRVVFEENKELVRERLRKELQNRELLSAEDTVNEVEEMLFDVVSYRMAFTDMSEEKANILNARAEVREQRNILEHEVVAELGAQEVWRAVNHKYHQREANKLGKKVDGLVRRLKKLTRKSGNIELARNKERIEINAVITEQKKELAEVEEQLAKATKKRDKLRKDMKAAIVNKKTELNKDAKESRKEKIAGLKTERKDILAQIKTGEQIERSLLAEIKSVTSKEYKTAERREEQRIEAGYLQDEVKGYQQERKGLEKESEKLNREIVRLSAKRDNEKIVNVFQEQLEIKFALPEVVEEVKKLTSEQKRLVREIDKLSGKLKPNNWENSGTERNQEVEKLIDEIAVLQKERARSALTAKMSLEIAERLQTIERELGGKRLSAILKKDVSEDYIKSIINMVYAYKLPAALHGQGGVNLNLARFRGGMEKGELEALLKRQTIILPNEVKLPVEARDNFTIPAGDLMPDWIRTKDGIGQETFRDMKWSDLEELHQLIEQYLEMGSKKLDLLKYEGMVTVEKAVAYLKMNTKKINDTNPVKGKDKLTDSKKKNYLLKKVYNTKNKFKQLDQRVSAFFQMEEFDFLRMDGYERQFFYNIFEEMRSAGIRFDKKMVGIAEQAQPFYKVLRDEVTGIEMRHGGTQVDIRGLKPTADFVQAYHQENYTPENILVMCMNMGNDSNLYALVEGHGIGREAWERWVATLEEGELEAMGQDEIVRRRLEAAKPQLDAIKAEISSEGWKAIQGLLDLNDSLFGEYNNAAYKVYRKSLVKEKAFPIRIERTADGQSLTLRGGYLPLAVDKRITEFDVAESRSGKPSDMKKDHQKQYTRSGIAKSATIARYRDARTGAPIVRRPIKLSLDILPQHYEDVSRFITHGKIVQEADRIFHNNEFKSFFEQKFGASKLKNLHNWLDFQVNPRLFEGDKVPLTKGLRMVNSLLSIGALGFNAGSAMKQGLSAPGAINVMNEEGRKNGGNRMSGYKYYALGQKLYLFGTKDIIRSKDIHGNKAANFVFEASEYMSGRNDGAFNLHLSDMHKYKVLNQDLVFKHKSGKEFKVTRDTFVNASFSMLHMVDKATVTPIWLGAFHQSLAMQGVEFRSDLDEYFSSEFKTMHPGAFEQAVKFADHVISESQPTTLSTDRAPIQQHQFFKMFLVFASYTHRLFNRMGYNYEKFFKNKNSWKEWEVGNMVQFFIESFALPALSLVIARAALFAGDDDEERDLVGFMKDIGWETGTQILGTVPFARDVKDVFNIYSGGLFKVPALNYLNGKVRRVANSAKKGDMFDTALHTTDLVSTYYGLPYYNVEKNLVRGWELVTEGEIGGKKGRE